MYLVGYANRFNIQLLRNRFIYSQQASLLPLSSVTIALKNDLCPSAVMPLQALYYKPFQNHNH